MKNDVPVEKKLYKRVAISAVIGLTNKGLGLKLYSSLKPTKIRRPSLSMRFLTLAVPKESAISCPKDTVVSTRKVLSRNALRCSLLAAWRATIVSRSATECSEDLFVPEILPDLPSDGADVCKVSESFFVFAFRATVPVAKRCVKSPAEI